MITAVAVADDGLMAAAKGPLRPSGRGVIEACDHDGPVWAGGGGSNDLSDTGTTFRIGLNHPSESPVVQFDSIGE